MPLSGRRSRRSAAAGKRDFATLERSFVVRAPDGLVVAYAAALAQGLREVLPRATLRFVPQAHGDRSALREGRIDLDPGSFTAHDPEVEVTLLSEHAPLAAVATGHPLARGRRTAQRYAAATHVAVMQRGGKASAVDDALAVQGLTRTLALTVPSSYAALVAAARLSFVATASERIVRAMAPALRLVVFELPFELPPRAPADGLAPAPWRRPRTPPAACASAALLARPPKAPALKGLPKALG